MRAVILAVVALAALAAGERLMSFSVALAQTPPADDAAPPLPDASPEGGASDEVVVDLSPDAQAYTPPPVQPAPPKATVTTPVVRYVHDRFYAGASTGGGHLVAWGSGPSGSASISGLAMNFDSAIGGSPVRGLAIAFVSGGATRIGSEFKGGPVVNATSTVGGKSTTMTLTGNARASTFLLGVRADWFPDPTGPWHVGADIGLGGVSVTDDAGKTITGFSVGGSIFGGYQWWLGPSWSLGIAGVVSAAPSLKMVDSDNNGSGYSLAPLYVGITSPILYY